jgi:inorganic pyrophosphatase
MHPTCNGDMAKKSKNWLANPEKLPPIDKKDDHIVQAVVETPKGSRNKFAFDPKKGVFLLKKVLPLGMVFPHDFGFVPSTKAEDGDPVDALILMDEPAFPGCLIPCRLIGVVEGEEIEDGNKVRNDRLIAVSMHSHTHSELQDIKDLDANFVKELKNFFVQYHQLDDKEYKCLGEKGLKSARRLLDRHVIGKAA